MRGDDQRFANPIAPTPRRCQVNGVERAEGNDKRLTCEAENRGAQQHQINSLQPVTDDSRPRGGFIRRDCALQAKAVQCPVRFDGDHLARHECFGRPKTVQTPWLAQHETQQG